MKKKYPLNKFLLIAISTIISFTMYGKNSLSTYSLSIDKSYNASALNDFEIINKYGLVKINEWENNTISIHIEITAKDKDKDDAIELAKNITFNEQNTSTKIAISTQFGNNKNSAYQYIKSFFKELSYSQNNITVNYTINIPSQLHAIKIENSFGDIQFTKLNSATTINANYSSVNGSEVSKSLILNLSFATVSISQLQNADINSSYSKVFCSSANKINILKSSFSTISLGSIDILNITKDNYGKIDIENINTINSNSSFSNIKIRKLNTNAFIKYSFGELRINEFANDANAIKIEGKFGSCNIGVQLNSSMKIHANAKMGDIKLNNITLNKTSWSEADNHIKILTGSKNCDDNNCTQMDISCEQCAINLFNYSK